MKVGETVPGDFYRITKDDIEKARNMTKGDGLYIASLEKNPRVECYDNAFLDEDGFMVVLVKGFAFYDAAERTEDDPDGRNATHGKSFYSIRDAQRRIRDAYPCKCGRGVK